MNNIITALIIVLSINALLMISQNAITEMNPDAQKFYTGQGGMIENFNINSSNIYDQIPTSGSSIQTDNGNFFTDVVGIMLSWLGKIPGFSTLLQTIQAPYNFLKILGLPSGVPEILGSLWYLTTLALLFLVITGRY